MTDSVKKALVVVVGLALTIGVVVWRSRAALAEARSGQHDHARMDVQVERFASPPAGIVAQVPYPVTQLEGLHALRLARLTVKHDFDELRATVESNSDLVPVRRAQLELGANTKHIVSVEEELGSATPGAGVLVEDVYLVHTGPLPGDLAPRVGQLFALVTDVAPGGPAAAAGLAVGDVVLALDDFTPDPSAPCERASQHSLAGASVIFHVWRDGSRVDLTATRGADGKYHYSCISAPYAGLP